MFKGVSLSVEDIYLLESFQIDYFPGWVPERESAAVLWAYPPIKTFGKETSPDYRLYRVCYGRAWAGS